MRKNSPPLASKQKRKRSWRYSRKTLGKIRPPFEKLVGDLSGAYSRRINIQHRLVYQVLEAEEAVKILRLWTHYE